MGTELLWLLAVFFAVIFAITRGLRMGLALLAGGAALGLLLGQRPAQVLLALARSTFRWETLSLVAAISLIQILNHVMRQTGQMQRLVDGLQRRLTDGRMLLMAVPTMSTVFPGPGGVLVSAPMLDAVADRLNLAAAPRAFYNYWFRHIIQLASPVTFSFVMATKVTGMPARNLFLYLVPASVIGYLVGTVILFTRVPRPEPGAPVPQAGGRSLWLDSLPLLAVVVLVIVLDLDLSLSLLVALLAALVVSRVPVRRAALLVGGGFSWDLALLMVGIQYFEQMVVHTGSAAAAAAAWSRAGLPVLLLITALPMATGLLLGHQAGTVALIFPLTQPVLDTYHLGVPYFATVYLLARIGAGLSPINASVALTQKHYGVSLWDVYRWMAAPTVAVVLVMLAVDRLA